MITEIDLMILNFTEAQKSEFRKFSPEMQKAWREMPLKARRQWAEDVERNPRVGVPSKPKTKAKPKPTRPTGDPTLAPEAPLTDMAACLMAWKPLDAADGWDSEKLDDAYDCATALVRDWYGLRPGVIGVTAASAVYPLRGSRIEAWVMQVFKIIDPFLYPDRRGDVYMVGGYDSRVEAPPAYTSQQPPVTLTALDDMPAPKPSKTSVPIPVFLEHIRREPAYANITAADVPHLPRLTLMRVMATIPETSEGAIEKLRDLAVREPDMAEDIRDILNSL